MTWICAASTLYGYGALYSDVQVSFESCETADLIQKAFPISNFVGAGFSGSVRIGFDLIDSLRHFLRLPAQAPGTLAWDPRWVAENWASRAKSTFSRAPRIEQNLRGGTSILMVAASPAETTGLGAKIYFVKFASPDFTPRVMSRAIQICSIGSGAKVTEYKRCVKPLLRRTSGIMHAEIMHQGGWARALGFSLSRVLADHRRRGISQHLHYLIIRRGAVTLETNDENIHPSDGPPVEIRMPEVAQDYDQFLRMAKSSGHAAAGASC